MTSAISWDKNEFVAARVVEQLLIPWCWQDQYGGVLHGINYCKRKMVSIVAQVAVADTSSVTGVSKNVICCTIRDNRTAKAFRRDSELSPHSSHICLLAEMKHMHSYGRSVTRSF